MGELKFGIVVVSGNCCARRRKDTTSPALAEAVLATFPDAKLTGKILVPNERAAVQKALGTFHSAKCNIIFTIGGTGTSSKDVTPEATKAFIEKEAPGMLYAMMSKSFRINDMSLMSRAVCGVKGCTLIVNFPADPKGALENFDFIKPAIPQLVTNLLGKRTRLLSSKGDVRRNVTSKVKITDLAKRIKIPTEKVSVSGGLFLMFTTCNTFSRTEVIDVDNSLTRILSEDVVSTEPCPPFPTAVVDGYAVRSADGPGIRTVKRLSSANKRPQAPLNCGEVISVSSGSVLPPGADAVVHIDNTNLIEVSEDKLELKVEIKCAPCVGLGVRGVGYDVPSYKAVLNKREKITPAHIGILSAIGHTKVSVFKRPVIGVMSIGRELQKFGDALQVGHVFDSTKILLFSLLTQHFYTADDCGIIEDDPASVKCGLLDAFVQHDIVVFTGGMHMGEKPVIKEVLLHDFNGVVHFEKVLMIPGFTLFATCSYNNQTKMVFTVPGSHSSATLATILLIIPLLRHLENCKDRCVHKLPLFLNKDMIVNNSQDYIKIKLETCDDDTVIKFTDDTKNVASKLDSFINVNGLLRWMDAKEITCDVCEDCSQKLCAECRNKTLGTFIDAILIDLM